MIIVRKTPYLSNGIVCFESSDLMFKTNTAHFRMIFSFFFFRNASEIITMIFNVVVNKAMEFESCRRRRFKKIHTCPRPAQQ